MELQANGKIDASVRLQRLWVKMKALVACSEDSLESPIMACGQRVWKMIKNIEFFCQKFNPDMSDIFNCAGNSRFNEIWLRKNRNRKKQLFDKANSYSITYLAAGSYFQVVIINSQKNPNYNQTRYF